jgi:error-prone DNA polymerase
MAAWRRRGGLESLRERLIGGMTARGYAREFAERIYHQILGFGEYGFPESHAASFALLVYVSAWLKHHAPAAFFAALINSQPMGFYAPAQLIREARRQGVEVRPVDVTASAWDCTLEQARDPALRLGLRLIKGLSRIGAERLVTAREAAPWTSVEDLRERAALDRGDLKALAAADALAPLTGNRHRAAWSVSGLPAGSRPDRRHRQGALVLPPPPAPGCLPLLAPPGEGSEIVADYGSLGLSLRRHPLALLRERLAALRLLSAREVGEVQAGSRIATAGLVINRQRPAAANHVTFVTLEDETGQVNLVVWRRIAERQRRALLGSQLLAVYGEVQREAGVTHVIAEGLVDYSPLLGTLLEGLVTVSRDFH